MSKVKADKYITIQGWMLTDLKLRGNELLVYAIIYGFSQDDESWFTGSRQYLADWCGCTVRSIQTILNNLVDKKLIIKSEQTHNGIKYCSYAADFTGGENFSRGDENFSHNNIVNNNSNTLSKDNDKATPEFNFGVSDEKSKKRTNNEEYLDACLLINNFTDDKELKKLLGELLDNRLSLASNQRHHFYASTFKHYLDELSKVHNKIGAVKLSLQYNNTLKVMEPKLQYVSITSTPDTNTAPQVKYSSDADRISKMARNDDGTPMTF